MIRIAYIPREDVTQIQGGDYLSVVALSKRLLPLDIQINVTPFNQLNTLDLPDAVFISQLYHVELAEQVLQWTQVNHVPLLLSPLHEDELALNFGAVLDNAGKWKRISHLLGYTRAEVIFNRWHTMRRASYTRWQRQRYILRNSSLLPNTQAELAHLTDWFQLRSPRAHIVPLGVDSNIYKSSIPPVDALPETLRAQAGQYILQVGLISQRKNQLGLMTALKDTPYPLVFLGRESPYELDYARQLRSAAKMRGNVTCIDHVDQQILLALYQHAAVHIMPSWSERPGLVTLEAAACGCRVVATNRSTINEYLGGRALYCDPIKPESIRAAISHALAKPASPDTSSYIAANYTWEHSAKSFSAALNQILNAQA